MALRYYSEFPANSGVNWRVEIHDSEFSGTETEFTLGVSGFEYSVNNNNAQRHTPVISTDVTLDFLIESSLQDDVIDDITGAPEGRFILHIYKDEGGGGGFTLDWAGIILTDVSKMPDIYYPFLFTIRATDGLGVLKKTNYSDKSGTEQPYEGFLRQIEIVKQCLTELPYIEEVWGASSEFITTAINWRPDTVSYGPAYCPLYYVYNDQRVFWQRKEKGETEYTSCYDVLENILTIYGARLIQSGGAWRIEQVEIRKGGAFFARKYNFDLDAPTFVGISQDYDVGLTEQYKRLRGIEYTWFTGVKKSSIVYNVYNRRNWLDGQVFNTNTDGVLPARQLGNVNLTSDQTKYKISGIFSYTLVNEAWTGLPGDFYVKFQITLKIGDYYAWRLANVDGYIVTYANFDWDNSTVRNITFVTQPRSTVSVGSSDTYNEVFEIVTDTIPLGGAVEFDVRLVDLVMMSGQNEFDFDLTWSFEQKWLEVLDYGAQVLQVDKVTYSAVNTELGNTEELESTVLIGDGTTLNSVGRLATYEQTAPTVWEYLNTENWNVGSASITGTLLLQLLADRILRGQRTPTRRMKCDILETKPGSSPYVHLPAHHAITHDEKNWLILGGRYSAREGVWSGEWFELNYTEVSGDTDPLDPKTDPIGGGFPEQPLIGGGASSGSGAHPGNVMPATLQPLACAYTSANLASGSITSIPLDYAVSENAFVAGEIVVLVNPANGYSVTTTVTASSIDGDTAVAVSSVDLPVDFYIGSYLIKSPKAGLASGSTYPANLWLRGTGSNIYRKSGNVAVGDITAPTNKLEVLAGSGLVERVAGFHSAATANSVVEVVNTNTAAAVLVAFDEVKNTPSFKGYIIRYGSTHATQPNKLSIVQAGSHEIAIQNNGADRIKIGTDGGINILSTIILGGSAGTTGQVLTSQGSAAVPTWTTISASVTSAESGTGIVSSKVRLGINPLLANTVINQDNFDLYFKKGQLAVVRYDTSPVSRHGTLQVEGILSAPVNVSTPSEDSVFIVQGYSGGSHAGNALAVGLFTSQFDGAWIQARNQNTPNNYYPIALNPRGGKLTYNRLTASSAQVTFKYDGSGSLLSNTILYLEGGDTNVTPKLGFGMAGTYNGGLGYFADAGNKIMRIYNTDSSGARSVRIAVGGETSDIVIVTEAGNTGFGHSSPTTIHSHVHSAGSFAAAALDTLGAPTFDRTKHVVVYTGTTTQTYTLPSASTCDGRVYHIWNHSAQTITLSSSVTKASGSSFNTITAGQHAMIVSVGGVWRGYKVASL